MLRTLNSGPVTDMVPGPRPIWNYWVIACTCLSSHHDRENNQKSEDNPRAERSMHGTFQCRGSRQCRRLRRAGMEHTMRSPQLLLPLARAMALQQILQLFLELPHVLEVPVDRGKPDVRHRIQSLEVLHDQLANLRGRPLPLRSVH
jgi:hypothetical protein